MGLISNGSTIFDNGSMASGFGGNMVFIKKLTASSSATLSFVDGTDGVVLDGTYKEYVFYFVNIHPQNDDVDFSFNLSTDSGSNYNVSKTSTNFAAYHAESDSEGGIGYESGLDLANGTGEQIIYHNTGNDNDQNGCGILTLYNPSSSVFVKHFIANFNNIQLNDYSYNHYVAGYGNTTSAINGIRFQMDSGNIDAGEILLFGVN
jgi:hypothetical protein